MSGAANIPRPHNEPVLSYAPGTAERTALKSALVAVGSERPDIPAVVGGREIRSGATQNVVSPHCHGRVLATLHQADGATIDAAVRSAVEAQRDWAHWRFEDRASVFLKAADLLATTWRQRLNAATMLGQSKTAYQAEIDSACELIDFLRFNVHYAERIYHEQPDSAPGAWNRMDHRPLEGFVYAITPFNFTAIGGNLPTAPALMGNAVVWKPAHSAALSNWHFYKLLEEAGLPPGVINFLPGDPIEVSRRLLASADLAGIHFTGSTTVFRTLWKTIGDNLEGYRGYPRIVGETGGKDFILAHPSADVDALAVAMVRGAYEYQGQKCSAASRAYIPDSLWPAVRERVVAMIRDIRMGDVADFRNFMGAVIDDRAFNRIRGHLERARTDPGVQVVAGGGTDDSVGYFVEPTLLQVEDPELSPHVRGALRAGAERPRLSRGPVVGDARAGGPDGAVRAHRGRVLPGPRRADRGRPRAPPGGGELLRERQTDRRGGGPAAVRRRAGERHQRQGRIDPQPAALGLAAKREGDARTAQGLPLSVHGGGVTESP